ncbi:hypothetical protein SOMG_02552 [Schizosaccharomyces osmophilus]|uniref:Uncharacterized protein n=1 Tax=Schizosaccharomyces osmophilus TaxID=2545709 RepID=A0AAE9WD60_9SCHI|nr:uncharacterized protein SOMG_02552 [Schizosaccharomyces osmophilus]WBW73735.1 hypothetical protein SOMG_02552 [Schizosaccharomyces osmophilus]
MLLSICILAFAVCFSYAINATVYDPLSLAINKNASARSANYPFYIQAFPYDFNCHGNLSFLQSPPPIDGQGVYSSMNNVSSFLTVPADNTSVTCVYTGYDKRTCYSGDSPKCFSISSSINNVDVSMNDSSHVLDVDNGFHVVYTESYYIITPQTTYAYVNESLEKPKHDPYAIYRIYLYSCDGNQTCMFDYLSGALTRDKQRCGREYSIKNRHFENKEKFVAYFDAQRQNTARQTSLSFIPPKFKAISNGQAVTQIELESSINYVDSGIDCISSSTSVRMKYGPLCICLAFGLIMSIFS